MINYSQNSEQEVILSFFNDKTGTFADIGSNDGIILSNTHALALLGWQGICIEPSPDTFQTLQNNYLNNDNVHCINVAVADYIGEADFYDSGTHLNKGDKSLLSSLDSNEIKRWRNTTTFEKVKVDVVDFKTLLKLSPYKYFSFISIDAEGFDLICLKQMNLTDLECKVICIEHNSNQKVKEEIISYCSQYGLVNVLLDNSENIILSG